MTVAARLRKLEAPSRAVTFEGTGGLSGAYSKTDPLWPLLADLAEAAEEVGEARNWPMTEDPTGEAGLRANFADFCAALDRLDAVLARVADQLDEAEQ